MLFLEEFKKKKTWARPNLKKKRAPVNRNFPENEKKYKRNKEKNKKKSTKYPSEDYLSRCQHRRYNLRAFQKKSARAFVLFAKARPQDHNLTEDKKKTKKTWKRISKSKLKKNIFVDTVIIVPLKLVLMNDDEFVSVKRARN